MVSTTTPTRVTRPVIRRTLDFLRRQAMHAVLTHLRFAAEDDSLFRGRDLGFGFERDSAELLASFLAVTARRWSSSLASAIGCKRG